MSEAEKAAVVPGPAAHGLVVQIAQELVEPARAERVSLVGQGALLQQVTRTVLQNGSNSMPSA